MCVCIFSTYFITHCATHFTLWNTRWCKFVWNTQSKGGNEVSTLCKTQQHIFFEAGCCYLSVPCTFWCRMNHRLRTLNEAIFHQNPKRFGLGRQFGQIHFESFGVFSNNLSACTKGNNSHINTKVLITCRFDDKILEHHFLVHKRLCDYDVLCSTGTKSWCSKILSLNQLVISTLHAKCF